jgi:molecular chaperone DnaK
MGDKLSDDDRKEINDRIEAVREALRGTDAGVVDSTKQQLAQVLQKIGTRAYEAAGAPEPGGEDGSGGGESGGPTDEEAAAPEEEGETIEGEYKEV